MDDDGQVETPVEARRHDRWTVAILALDWAAKMTGVTSDTLNQFTFVAMQHANQKKYDKKFNDIVRRM